MKEDYSKITHSDQIKSDSLRSRVEQIRKRAESLPEPDRTVIRMYLDNSTSFRQIAQLLDVSETTVSRRIKKIITRLMDTSIDEVFKEKHRSKKQHNEIAQDYFLRGLSVKTIAHKNKTSFFKARQIIGNMKKTTNRNQYKTKVRYY